MVTDFTPRFALATGARNHSYAALKKTKECLANIECKVVDIITKHNIVMLEGIAVHVDRHRTETRTLHAVGDGTFIVDGVRINKRAQMLSKLPPGV
jgi:flavin reductase (DIM6/NTAB) family NADH-FMN oxidoreductase RutF